MLVFGSCFGVLGTGGWNPPRSRHPKFVLYRVFDTDGRFVLVTCASARRLVEVSAQVVLPEVSGELPATLYCTWLFLNVSTCRKVVVGVMGTPPVGEGLWFCKEV